MEPRAHHVLIGLFTVLALAGGLLFALWLAKSSADRDYDYFLIVFERVVSGLAEGNPVQYSGIRVGDVLSLGLDPEDPNRVRVLIRVDREVPVNVDTRAGLTLTNITGSMSIQLRGGTPESRRITGTLEAPGEILAEPSPLGSLLADSEALVGGAQELVGRLNRLLSDENSAATARLLTNLADFSEALAAQGPALGELTAQLSAATRGAAEASDEFRRLGRDANALLERRGEALFDGADEGLAHLAALFARLDALVADHQGSLDQGLHGLGELGPTLRELRGTLGNLNRLTQRLEEDPAGVLLGRDTLPEYTP